MATSRVLTFRSRVLRPDFTHRDYTPPDPERPEPVSPFTYKMPERQLTPRERQHRRRMVDTLRARHFIIKC